jgi:hypothetical protein
MIKRLILFLIALLNIAGAMAQTKKKTTAKKNAAAVNAFQLEKTLLWEISGNGLTNLLTYLAPCTCCVLKMLY